MTDFCLPQHSANYDQCVVWGACLREPVLLGRHPFLHRNDLMELVYYIQWQSEKSSCA